MSEFTKLLDVERAQMAAERFILERYPYASISFQRAELKNYNAQQLYEFAGYCVLSKWPRATSIKKLCQIQVDAQSADILEHRGI